MTVAAALGGNIHEVLSHMVTELNRIVTIPDSC